MDGRKSRLADRISDKYKDEIKEKNKTGSVIGETYEIDGIKYVVTDGEINLEKTFEKIRERLNKYKQ